MLDLAEIARREERRLAEAHTELATAHVVIPETQGGGVITRGEPGNWINTSEAIGLSGPVDRRAIDAMIAFHTQGGVEPRTEVSPFAHPSLLSQLGARGFTARRFTTVFFRQIQPSDPVRPRHTAPEITIEQLNPQDDAAVAEYALAVAAGYAQSQPVRASEVALWNKVLQKPIITSFAALDAAGRIIGGGSIEVHGDYCTLFGLSVLKDFRRRGVQQMLLAARLNHAAQVGVRFATISSRPGAPTERNARRMGFQVAYNKVAVALAGPGLKPVV